jgi:hypothetical protein
MIMYYQFSHGTVERRRRTLLMDLSLGKHSNSRLRYWARLSAFGCFMVAAGILVASLLMPTPAPGLDGHVPGTTASIR